MTQAAIDDSQAGILPYSINDAEALSKNMVRLFEEGGKAVSHVMEKASTSDAAVSASDLSELSRVLGDVAKYWMSDPGKLMEANTKLMHNYAELWGRSVRRFLGENVEPVVEPEPGDNRFKDPGWTETQFFDFWKQAYLVTSHWAEGLVENAQGLDDKTHKKAEFYVRQIVSALSPANFAITNPEVVRETLATNGENLVRGLTHLREDLERSDGLLRVRQTDHEAFEVGKNLAITPGKVVYQNDIMQLIQYSPTTDQVYRKPLLIVPPWINKFYILDLVPQKSFVRWAVEQGFTVFIMSWVNPDERLAQKTFDDYMKDGVINAVEQITKVTGEPSVNTLGYCVGGTLLAAAMAYMAEHNDERIASATFFTTQVDFARAGDLLVFIDDSQLRSLEEMMTERGYLDGSHMASMFNMLRPNDLIWPFVVNNYLLGKQPFPFDLLFWNSDSTRMPAANHAFYLRNFYHENKLSKGELILAETKLDLSNVKAPIYHLAAKEDHIAPPESCYHGGTLFGGPVRFVLAGSGHIAGVINPPTKPKYQYWTNGYALPQTMEEWFENAGETEGSWWPDWAEWLAERSDDKIEPREPGAGELKAIEDAPGSFVMERI